MKIKLVSPESVPMNPVLFPTFIKTFNDNGHSFVGDIKECDIVFMDLHTRIAEYNQSDIDYMVENKTPIVTFDEFDKGGMSDLQWPHPLTPQQSLVMSYCIGSGIHFCRLLDKTKMYPLNLHPYEKPILYEEPLHTADELFNREYDIVWIANTAPQRLVLEKSLKEYGKLKCNIKLGQQKILYNDWIAEHRKGKFFISCSAGGYSNECVQSLFSVSCHLRENTDQLLLHPFTNLENCLQVDIPPTKEQLDAIYETVNDKDKLYSIYKQGYNHVKKYYSEEYMANNILSILKKEGIC